jgi:hypothetical protein
MIESVHPPTTCKLLTKPLRAFDDCIPDEYVVGWAESCWSIIYTGLHEGLDARDTSVKCTYLTCIGHLLTAKLEIACAQLDFSIRRGCDVSRCNLENNTVLRQATLYCAQESTHTPVGFTFFQVLADAHAPYEVSKNNTAELIRKCVNSKPYMNPNAPAFRNRIADLFDRQTEE